MAGVVSVCRVFFLLLLLPFVCSANGEVYRRYSVFLLATVTIHSLSNSSGPTPRRFNSGGSQLDRMGGSLASYVRLPTDTESDDH